MSIFVTHMIFLLIPAFVKFPDNILGDSLTKLRYSLNGPGRAARELRLFNLDDRDLGELDILDSDRTIYARILDALGRAECKTLLYNLIFRSPKSGDQELVLKTKELGSVFYPVYLKKLNGGTNDEIIKDFIWYPEIVKTGNPLYFNSLLSPFEELAVNSAGLGTTVTLPGDNRIHRRIPLVVAYENGYLPSLVLRGVIHFFNVKPENIKVSFGEKICLMDAETPYGEIKDYCIPIDNRGRMLINYTGPWEDSLASFPVRELLNPGKEELLKEVLSGSLVLISDITTEKKDFVTGIFDPIYPHSGVIAHALNTILTEDYLRESSYLQKIVISLILGTGIILFAIKFKLKILFLLIPAGILVIFLISIFLFIYFNQLPEISLYIWEGGVAICALVIYRHFSRDKSYVEMKTNAPGLPIREENIIIKINEAPCREFNITPRQREILYLLQQDYTYSKIAETLEIHVGTVKRHILSLKEKTGLIYKNDILNLFFPLE